MDVSFLQSISLSIINLIIGLFGGYYLSIYSKRKKLLFVRESRVLIKNKGTELAGLRVLFNDKEIEFLTSTIMYFWNGGRECIKKEDIARKSKITVKINGDTELLKADIAQIEDNNDFRIYKTSKEEIIVDFEYANSNEGFKLLMLHTGEHSDLAVSTAIKNGVFREIKLYSNKITKFITEIGIGVTSLILVLAISLLMYIDGWVAYASFFSDADIRYSQVLCSNLLLIILIAILCFVLKDFLGKPKPPVPKKLLELSMNDDVIVVSEDLVNKTHSCPNSTDNTTKCK